MELLKGKFSFHLLEEVFLALVVVGLLCPKTFQTVLPQEKIHALILILPGMGREEE